MIIQISGMFEAVAIIIGSMGVIGGGLYWFYLKILKPVHIVILAAAEIIDRELTNDHGQSMKDKLELHIQNENDRWTKHDIDADIVRRKLEEFNVIK